MLLKLKIPFNQIYYAIYPYICIYNNFVIVTRNTKKFNESEKQLAPFKTEHKIK